MTRPSSKLNRLGIYADVREVADMLLAHGGGTYTLPDRGAAQNFAHRFYRWRILYRDLHHADGSECPYDKLICARVKDEHLHFTIRRAQGVFKPSGPSAGTAPTFDDDLFNIAEQIARKIQGEA